MEPFKWHLFERTNTSRTHMTVRCILCKEQWPLARCNSVNPSMGVRMILEQHRRACKGKAVPT
jgi:hypothetical protein